MLNLQVLTVEDKDEIRYHVGNNKQLVPCAYIMLGEDVTIQASADKMRLIAREMSEAANEAVRVRAAKDVLSIRKDRDRAIAQFLETTQKHRPGK